VIIEKLFARALPSSSNLNANLIEVVDIRRRDWVPAVVKSVLEEGEMFLDSGEIESTRALRVKLGRSSECAVGMTTHESIDPTTRGFTTAKGCDLGRYGAFGKRNASDTEELDPGAEDLLL
jgi:hypothetical protein